MEDLRISPSVTIPGGELTWSATRASGPGGQNVNKVATKVDLRFDLEANVTLSTAIKARLRRAAVGRFDAEGRIVIVSTKTRVQSRNIEDARERLAELVRSALVPPKRRRATKPSRGAKRRRMDAKRRNSDKKKGRGRVNADD